MEFPDIFHIKYMKGRNELMTANRFEQLAEIIAIEQNFDAKRPIEN